MRPANETPSPLDLQNPSTRSSVRSSSQEPAHLRPTTPSSVHSSSSELGDNDIIPPHHPAAPRTLVLCFDGTGDQFDADNSNVVKFFSLLKRDDRREQMVYYQTGIGTYTSPQLVTSAGQAISKTLDEMVAWNLATHVMGGYEFLMQNYEAGDKICLFGFSRGAYTARALAGMLHKIGLLPSHNHQQVPFAYKMFTRTDEVGWQQSTAFKKAFCIDIDVEFIGVWDTVCSVGVFPHRLPFSASNTAIRTFRHALSLDERRAKFKANHYNRPSDWEMHQGTRPGEMPRPVQRRSSHGGSRSNSTSKPMSPSRLANLTKHMHAKEATTATATTAVATPGGTVQGAVAAVVVSVGQEVEKGAEVVVEQASKEVDVAVEAVDKATEAVASAANEASSKLWVQARNKFGSMRALTRKKGKRLTAEEDDFDKTDIIQGETDVKEVWFAGCHCDVGGGSVRDEEKYKLARIPLRWMIRECFRTHTGIRFHAELLKDIGLDPATLWPYARPSVEFGPGLAHVPQIPPLPPSPRISFDPPTPPERSMAELEKRVLQAMEPLANAPAPVPTPKHDRHVSTSTARTLVAPKPIPHPMHGHDHEVVVDEDEEERKDAVCPAYDQLALKPWWWILELLPIEQRKQLPNKRWKKYTSFNLGRGRVVPPDTKELFFHRSVKIRMDDQKLKYKPKATWGDLQPVYVD